MSDLNKKGGALLYLIIGAVLAIAACICLLIRSHKVSRTSKAPALPTETKIVEEAKERYLAPTPVDPRQRALFLNGKLLLSERDQQELRRLQSDKSLIEAAKNDWLANRDVTNATNFLNQSFAWERNPKRADALYAIEQILIYAQTTTPEQEARRVEMLVRLVQQSPADFRVVKSKLPKELLRAKSQYFHHYSRT